MRFHIISALDSNRGIGYKNNLPWDLKGDMKHFKSITGYIPEDDYFNYMNVVVMGRNTWDSIPAKFKPLPNRINIILSRQTADKVIGDVSNSHLVYVISDWQDVFSVVNKINKDGYIDGHESEKPISVNNIYVIGGQKIYESAINHPYCDKIYLTEVCHSYDVDTYFPKLSDGRNNYKLIDVSKFESDYDSIIEETVYYRFVVYQNETYFLGNNINENVINSLNVIETNMSESITDKLLINQLKRRFTRDGIFINHEEEKFHDFVRDIRDNGVSRTDRTGVGTVSLFGKQLTFDLRDTFPMITTKKMFPRGIFEELMMYLRGQTDNKILQSKKIHIWDGNTSRQFLDKIGLQHFEEGDMGATYGFNFRHYGAKYEGCKKQYDETYGFDQLNYAIELIRNNPTSRRILINLWNPTTLNQVALPSCLCQYQFYVNTETKELNLQIYIRSSDVFLANNWNACTGAMLVHMICNLNGIELTPGDLSVITGDAHLYNSHLDGVNQMLERTPRPFPKLVIKNKKDKIEDFNWEDIGLYGYNPYPGIKVEMAV